MSTPATANSVKGEACAQCLPGAQLWRLASLLLLGIMIFLPVWLRAEQRVSLAADHPEAAIFRQMARRGALDFAASGGRLPASLSEIQDNGFSAYLFPTNWRPEFQHNGNSLTIASFGRPSFLSGRYVNGYDINVDLPPGGLFVDAQVPAAIHGVPMSQREMVIERRWSFPGAQWLHAGYGNREVALALRAERLSIHLNFLTYEFQATMGRMPQSLDELERFCGTERNSLGWEGLNEVSVLSDVGWQPGSFFIGWDHNDWVISMNLGPEVSTQRWKPGYANGQYSSRQAIVY